MKMQPTSSNAKHVLQNPMRFLHGTCRRVSDYDEQAPV